MQVYNVKYFKANILKEYFNKSTSIMTAVSIALFKSENRVTECFMMVQKNKQTKIVCMMLRV